MNKPTVVDLFCGAGGFSLGFELAGFKLLRATDSNQDCIDTYIANFGELASCDGVRETGFAGLKPDVVIGGPPCQPFSMLGPKTDLDPRRGLTKKYMEVVAALMPKVFLIENVPGYFKSVQAKYVLRVSHRLKYRLSAALLDASEHGVPQRRKRAFIIGSRIGIPFFPAGTEEVATVRDAIHDLTGRPTGNNWHVGRTPEPTSILRYKAVPEGGNRLSLPRSLCPPCWQDRPSGSVDVFGRLWWHKPSVTVRTEFIKPEKGRYLHPVEHRPITPREGARLQSFPDSFVFSGSMTSVVRQIGNAVPPRLALRLARAIAMHLEGANGQLTGENTYGFPITMPLELPAKAHIDRQLRADLLRSQ